MKKTISLLLVVTIVATFLGCMQTQPTEPKPPEEQASLQPQQLNQSQSSSKPQVTSGPNLASRIFVEDVVVTQLEITEYSYDDSFSSWVVLVIKNNSEYDMDLTVHLNQFDESGTMVGVESQTTNAFESGQETVLTYLVDHLPASTEYEFDASESDYYEPVRSDLSYEILSTSTDKIVVAVTNNGTEAADFVIGTALFFSQGNLVNHGIEYFVDSNSEIGAGETINKEIYSYIPFDDVHIYLSGTR